MERRLLEAARKGNVEELNDLIKSNGLILEEMALEGDGHTPLHIACVAGHMNFVRELLKLMPKFAEKVNANGFSPLHIAAARGDVEIARELLRVGQLCSVKGRERRIPLHYAVINGELDVMKVLLSASPESVKETTAREEMALHLAVKNNRFDAVVVLVEHLKKYNKEEVINWKDHEGNTVLHLAAASKNFEVVKFLLSGIGLEYKVVEVNALNKSGLTPLDVLTLSQMGEGDKEMIEILARAEARPGRERSNTPASLLVSVDEDSIGGDNSRRSEQQQVHAHQTTSSMASRNSNEEKESLADIRNALLVVAALIASATYQAMLQPPSYKIKVDDSYKKSIHGYGFNKDFRYILFMSFNTFGFLLSVQTMICLIRDLPVRLPLLMSMYSMVLTYATFLGGVFSSFDKELNPKNEGLFIDLPIIISVLLLLTQQLWALAFDFLLAGFSKCHIIVGDIYNLRADPNSQGVKGWAAKMKNHRMPFIKAFGKALEKFTKPSD